MTENEKTQGYIVETEITEEDKDKKLYQKNPYDVGKYITVLKPSKNRVQVNKFDPTSEYKVVYDHEREDDFTMSDVKRQDNILTRKLMQKMMSEAF
ncbi:MAG: hypothetical protein ACOC1X_03035 [Promethearchaeota archaeon]